MRVILLLIIFFSQELNAQSHEMKKPDTIFQRSYSRPEYQNVDSIMRSYHERITESVDLYKVVYFIRTNFREDSMRLRAAFIWITDNIDYDVEAWLKDDPAAGNIDYVIKKRKAICGGYANLLKYFCDKFSIESRIINGYARTERKDIYMRQTSLRSNHSWNLVKVNGEWKLLDPTWSAGFVVEPEIFPPYYVKFFNEIYYFTAPEKFILNHYPLQPPMQMLPRAFQEKQYMKWPMFTSNYLSENITAIKPDSAYIRIKKGDSIHFRFKTNAEYDSMFAIGDVMEKLFFAGKQKRNGDWIEFSYPVRVPGLYNLYIGYYSRKWMYFLVAYKIEVN